MIDRFAIRRLVSIESTRFVNRAGFRIVILGFFAPQNWVISQREIRLLSLTYLDDGQFEPLDQPATELISSIETKLNLVDSSKSVFVICRTTMYQKSHIWKCFWSLKIVLLRWSGRFNRWTPTPQAWEHESLFCFRILLGSTSSTFEGQTANCRALDHKKKWVRHFVS